jgi:hypothetical protein
MYRISHVLSTLRPDDIVHGSRRWNEYIPLFINFQFIQQSRFDSRCQYCKGSYIRGSVYRNSILIRSDKMQQYAGIYLLQNHFTCFECPLHPSSGVHETVTAASGTGHSIWATVRRGLIRPRRRKIVAQILWLVPETAVTVLCTPDDECNGHPKHVEWFCSK